MKSIKILFACLVLNIPAFAQSIDLPFVSSAEDPVTVITKVETDHNYTVVYFRHTSPQKGAWVQLNKSIYLQDANGDDRYNYVRSEGIAIRPEKAYSTKDNEVTNFKVYFEKLKPGTRNINIIERARSQQELNNGYSFMNYYMVSLSKTQAAHDAAKPLSTSITERTTRIISDTAVFHPAMAQGCTRKVPSQLNNYTSPEAINQMAKITKSYYDALIKTGFAPDAALKIVTAKQF